MARRAPTGRTTFLTTIETAQRGTEKIDPPSAIRTAVTEGVPFNLPRRHHSPLSAQPAGPTTELFQNVQNASGDVVGR